MSMADGVSDAELLVAVPRDVSAFETFYDRYFGRVTAFGARRCSCAEDVADVVAETFVRLLGAAERYDPDRAQPVAFVLASASPSGRCATRLPRACGSRTARRSSRAAS
jgi:DNA-directed RNA polymerase specialized sigma24 family protein